MNLKEKLFFVILTAFESAGNSKWNHLNRHFGWMRDADAGIDADAGCGNRTADDFRKQFFLLNLPCDFWNITYHKTPNAAKLIVIMTWLYCFVGKMWIFVMFKIQCLKLSCNKSSYLEEKFCSNGRKVTANNKNIFRLVALRYLPTVLKCTKCKRLCVNIPLSQKKV